MILTVLKIIGIVILAVLGLLLLLAAVLLTVPIHYRFDGSCGEELYGEAVVNWNPLLLKATVRFRDKKPEYMVKLLGGVILTNTGKKVSWLGRRFFSFADGEQEKKKPPDKKAKQEVTGVVIDDTIEWLEEPKYREDGETGGKSGISSRAEKRTDSSGKTEKKKRPADSSGRKKEKKEPIFSRISKKRKAFSEKWNHFLEKLREVGKKKDALLKVYHSPRFTVAKKDAISYIRVLLGIVKPRHLQGNVQFGLSDPAATGQALGLLSLALPLYDDYLVISPDFEQACLRGNLSGDGKIRLFPVVKLALKVIFNKNLIKVTKKVQTIIEA